MTEFVKAGAPEEILFVSKPHIGTFRLVGMVEKMRAEIEALGGEIRFQQRVADVLIEGGAIRGVTLASGEQLRADHVVLALGHSARDTFEMLHRRGVFMEAKPFSIGYRIEHPQSLIDRRASAPAPATRILGAADYKLVHHASNGRSVYSFCMCPGGTVVAATSELERVVTNGMSQYSRNERNANAGIVVGITPQDYRQDGQADGPVNPLDGMAFQRFWESRAYALGGGGYVAPGQLVGDFTQGPAQQRLRAACCRPTSPASARPIWPSPVNASLPGLRDRRDPRGAAGVRAPDQGLLDGRRGADRRRDTHLVAAAHHPRQGFPEPQRQGPVPGR